MWRNRSASGSQRETTTPPTKIIPVYIANQNQPSTPPLSSFFCAASICLPNSVIMSSGPEEADESMDDPEENPLMTPFDAVSVIFK
ncbi:hypothetical protein RP20_CCG020646 [Aedes albopictus]|nr:hypothetical protein RP20_CCG020646 [Aedes albopictus]